MNCEAEIKAAHAAAEKQMETFRLKDESLKELQDVKERLAELEMKMDILWRSE